MATPKKRSIVVIANRYAGRSSESARQEVIADLADRFDPEVVWTAGRDTGTAIAEQACDAGAELVVAYGGDGHVNEVVNALAGTDVPLGIIPGGTMNVFARALGIPGNARAAVEHLVSIRRRPSRRVNLGKMDDRFFTFSAGCGFDAEAAELVESHLEGKRRLGEPFFYWSALRVLAGSYRHRSPTMTIDGAFGSVPVSMAIACNAGPYAYLFGRPIRLTPEVELEGGLDLFALRRMRLEALPWYAWGSAVSGDMSGHPDAFTVHEAGEFTITSSKSFHRHVDGEPLPTATKTSFSLHRNALSVLA
ncbi:MAG: diacylglycerol/lipid kinase family protein [Actinomycetota bacterium]